MQIPPGDAYPRNVSGSVAQPGPVARQVPNPQTEARLQAQTPAADGQTQTAPNSPPPVARAHSVERIAHGTVPRDIPCGSLIDIEV